jgi:SSS family solute:Na+ symporter
MNFTALDAVIVGAYLALSMAAGLWAKRYLEDLPSYIVAGRRVGLSLGIATLVATEIGTVTFMYFAELGYVSGFACFILGILYLIGYSLIGKTGFIVRGLRQLRVMTIPEFYELRYSRKVRLFGGLILFFAGVLNTAVFLKFDGIFLSEVMGFGQAAISVIMVVMILIVIVYTVLGGMLSVIVTDFLQFVMLTLGMLVATIFILARIHPSAIAEAVMRSYGAAGFNPVVHPRFGWTFMIWAAVSIIAASALWQPGTMKALASASPEIGKKVYFYTGLTFAGRAMIPMFWGVAALAYFGGNEITTAAMPKLLGQVIPTGLLGLLVAGMLAASMSTYSAYLLSWCSVAVRDVVAGFRLKDFDDAKTMKLIRVFVVFVGLGMLAFGLWYQIPDTAYQYLVITGTMYSAGALGCVAFGLYWKKANTLGAYISLTLGAVGPIAFLLLEKSRDTLPTWAKFLGDVNISGLLGFVFAPLGMVLGSLLSQELFPPKILTLPQAESS